MTGAAWQRGSGWITNLLVRLPLPEGSTALVTVAVRGAREEPEVDAACRRPFLRQGGDGLVALAGDAGFVLVLGQPLVLGGPGDTLARGPATPAPQASFSQPRALDTQPNPSGNLVAHTPGMCGHHGRGSRRRAGWAWEQLPRAASRRHSRPEAGK